MSNLVLTGNSETFSKSDKNILAGSWCKQIQNFEEFSENYITIDYHWENIVWLVKLGFQVEKTPYYLDDHHFYRVFYCNFQKTDTKIDKSRPIMH